MGNLLRGLLQNFGDVANSQVVDIAESYGVDDTNLNRFFEALSRKEPQSTGIVIVEGATENEVKNWVSKLEDKKQVEIFESMNDSSSSFSFSSFDELGLNLKIRAAIIRKIIEVESAWNNEGFNPFANYPSGNEPFFLPTDYWRLIPIPGENGGFRTINGVEKSKAIESLFSKNQDIVVDCNRMSVIIAYGALLDSTGEDFNKIFKDRDYLMIGTWHDIYDDYGKITLLSTKYFLEEVMSKKGVAKEENLCIPGDIVYFKNADSYKLILQLIPSFFKNDNYTVESKNEFLADERFNLAWTGEYCICTASNRFAGFGLRESNLIEFSSAQIKEKLLKSATDLYNLVKEKAQPIHKKLEDLNIPKPTIDDVVLYPKGYRLNSRLLTKKMSGK